MREKYTWDIRSFHNTTGQKRRGLGSCFTEPNSLEGDEEDKDDSNIQEVLARLIRSGIVEEFLLSKHSTHLIITSY